MSSMLILHYFIFLKWCICFPNFLSQPINHSFKHQQNIVNMHQNFQYYCPHASAISILPFQNFLMINSNHQFIQIIPQDVQASESPSNPLPFIMYSNITLSINIQPFLRNRRNYDVPSSWREGMSGFGSKWVFKQGKSQNPLKNITKLQVPKYLCEKPMMQLMKVLEEKSNYQPKCWETILLRLW